MQNFCSPEQLFREKFEVPGYKIVTKLILKNVTCSRNRKMPVFFFLFFFFFLDPLALALLVSYQKYSFENQKKLNA